MNKQEGEQRLKRKISRCHWLPDADQMPIFNDRVETGKPNHSALYTIPFSRTRGLDKLLNKAHDPLDVERHLCK